MLIAMLIQTALTQSDKTQSWITFLAGWVALGFLALMGIAILYYVFTEKINLSGLISEPSGEASMSRFQLLIFTFVIAASLFLIVVTKSDFPNPIPNGILVLLGISSSSYLVSKGIQSSSPQGLSGRSPHVTVSGSSNSTTPGGQPIKFQAEVLGPADATVIWSLDPPAGLGTIDQSGLYTPPAAPVPNLPVKVTIQATSKEDVSLTDTNTISLV